MIKFEQALEIVLSNSLEIEKELVPLSDALGRILSSSVYSDRDMPPFNKSAVDGYACKESDLGKELVVAENIPAGYNPKVSITSGICSKIMTGAKVPEGADTIIMVEDTVIMVKDTIIMVKDIVKCGDKIKYTPTDGKKPRNNICLKGEDLKAGDLIIGTGTQIKPEQIAILAAVGISEVPVSKILRIGLLSTGDEIVEPEIAPDEVQIRNSNSWQLRAQILRCGSFVNYYGIVSDNEKMLRNTISKALSENDILILTGGVSMGDFDFVPAVLKDLGLEILFDKIAVQPGKPSTFAVKRSASEPQKTEKVVFALPGNPVSCYVQLELLVKPFIFKSMGAPNPVFWFEMPSADEFKRNNIERKAFIPVKIGSDGRFNFIKYNGSAHIVALNQANAIAEIPIGLSHINSGDKLRIFLLP